MRRGCPRTGFEKRGGVPGPRAPSRLNAILVQMARMAREAAQQFVVDLRASNMNYMYVNQTGFCPELPRMSSSIFEFMARTGFI